jgi:hypothetical protein
VSALTRTQRNAVADVIIAALHDRVGDDTLTALADVLAATDAVAVDQAAAARLAVSGFVVTQGDAAVSVATSDDATPRVRIVVAPVFAPVRREAMERVERGRRARDAYWRAPTPGGPAFTHVEDGVDDADLGATLRRAAALFEARLYFEVHEELEALWRRANGTTRTVVQGLLQVAVALHHAERGNVAGARRLLAAGRAKIEAYAPRWRGVAIAALLGDLRRWEDACLDRGESVAPPRLVLE